MPAGIAAFLTPIIGATAAGIAAPVLVGAGLGAGTSAITGHSIGKGALFGGLTGGALGGAGALGSSLGLEAGGLAQGLLTTGLGAAAGAGASALTGGNVGKGALFGGLAGGLDAITSSPLGGGGTPSGNTVSPGGTAPSAVGSVSGTPLGQASIASGGIPDLTAPIETINVTAPSLGGAAGGGASAGGAFAGAASPGAITKTDLPDLGSNSDAGLSTPTLGTKAIAPGQPGALSGGSLATGSGGGQTSGGKFLADPTVRNFGNFVGDNPAAVVGALGLGYQALSQPKVPSTSATTNALMDQAKRLDTQGAGLMSYITNGTLPPGAMQAVNTATNAAKATIKSRYAAMGLSGSTSEATALAGVEQQATGQIFEIANSLLNAGIKESGLSSELYKAILQQSNQNDTRMSDAIANFAASIAGNSASSRGRAA